MSPMPESAEDVYARIVEAVGPDGHLPMPPQGGWDIFPWTVVDGEIAPRTLAPPADEAPRWGESPDKPCSACEQGFDAAAAHFGLKCEVLDPHHVYCTAISQFIKQG